MPANRDNHCGEPRFKKSLGQNFLRDKNLAYKIAKSVPTDIPVLEIGPGDGFFTESLLDAGHQVIAVEIDDEWLEKLQRRLKRFKSFKLISGNFLKLEWNELGKEFDRINITGNLPFHLATATLSAIFQLVRDNRPPLIENVIVMMQREVGRRITGSPGSKDYSSFTLITNYHADSKYLFTVPSISFFPKPKVNGAIIQLKLKKQDELPEIDFDIFRCIVRGCFAQRRKMLRNSLNVVNDLPEGWKDLDYDFTRRPDQLSFDEYVALSKDIKSLMDRNCS